ncbi:MAG: hypothetical protein MOGMAGMI_02120 [Candidatus Omnitrophica bacterium]|nr:hypothetical protein [Candidatus Omnitrophota bacterium]
MTGMPVQNDFYKNVSVIGAVVCVAVAGWAVAAGRTAFAAGTLVGYTWMFLNGYFLFRLLDIGLNAQFHKKDQVLLLSIVKFPVLYVAGFFILRSGAFPVSALLIGTGLFFVALSAAWMKANLSGKMAGPERLS